MRPRQIGREADSNVRSALEVDRVDADEPVVAGGVKADLFQLAVCSVAE